MVERAALPTTDTTPFDTDSCSTGAPSLFDASVSRACRASAAAARIWGPPLSIDALETVAP